MSVEVCVMFEFVQFDPLLCNVGSFNLHTSFDVEDTVDDINA